MWRTGASDGRSPRARRSRQPRRSPARPRSSAGTTARSTPSTRSRGGSAGRPGRCSVLRGGVVDGGHVFDATVDGVVHAFDVRSGTELWSRRIGRFGYSAAALSGGRVYVGSYDHRLYALDADTGAVLWTHEAPGPVSGAPTVLGRLVFFSSCGSCSSFESNPRTRRTFAVDAETGRSCGRSRTASTAPSSQTGGASISRATPPCTRSSRGSARCESGTG